MRPSLETVKLWVALNLAQRKIYREIDAALKKENLPSLRWYDVLWTLYHNPQGVRANDMKSTLLFEQSNLSRLLRRMIDEGLVEERRSTQDRRAKLLFATKKGKKTHDEMWEIYGQHIQKLIGGIPEHFNAPHITEALKSLVESEMIDQYFQ